MNPAADEWMTKIEGGYGKVVWLPTFDSESQAKLSGGQRPFVPVTRDGKILPEVLAVIALGALLELGHSPLTDEQLRKQADAIRAIGAESFVLSSDLGQPPNPLHTDGLLAMYRGLIAQGISAGDIDTMSRKNPARLLGL